MSLKIEENVSLAKFTTLQVGGAARYLVRVGSVEEVKEAAIFAQQKSLPLLCLGSASNVLIDDKGYEGVVIINQLKGRLYEEQDETIQLVCGSGEILDEVVADVVAKGYWGLENLSAIPGTVGATPVQNVGAYGVEVGELITKVETINLVDGSEKIFSNQECAFGYRDSFFKTSVGKKFFITKVHFVLQKKDNPKIEYKDLQKYFSDTTPTLSEIRKAVVTIRSEKFPDWTKVGTAGSFFKNPIIDSGMADKLAALYPELPVYKIDAQTVKIPLGYVLDKICGLRGYKEGVVGLYQNQALVLVNYGDATATQVKNFATEIRDKVFLKTNISIEPEVTFVTEEKFF